MSNGKFYLAEVVLKRVVLNKYKDKQLKDSIFTSYFFQFWYPDNWRIQAHACSLPLIKFAMGRGNRREKRAKLIQILNTFDLIETESEAQIPNTLTTFLNLLEYVICANVEIYNKLGDIYNIQARNTEDTPKNELILVNPFKSLCDMNTERKISGHS